ncbi:MAG: STAS domain-containing protein [Calditrichaeota bacterium]|nr:STAS domain-containing protein [Calditrichota bacterium]
MELEVFEKKNVAILKIAGDVDLYSSPQVRKKILALMKKKIENLLVDLDGVSYMDSSGVATLVEALQLMNKRHGKLKLFNLKPAIRDVFELSRLDKVFDICEDESQAMTAVSEE